MGLHSLDELELCVQLSDHELLVAHNSPSKEVFLFQLYR